MMKRLLIGASLALGTATMVAPASAQVNVPVQGGLVNVAVGDVILQDILTDIEITALNDLDILNDNQIIVQVPIGIAANVCNVSAAVLARQAADAAQCDASSGSQALAQAIRKQHLRNR